MWKQAVLAGALVAVAGGCEERATPDRTSGSVTGESGMTDPYTTAPRATEPKATQPGMTDPSLAERGQDAAVAQADRNFLREAANVHRFEIELGQLALQKSRNNDVRAFAQTLVRDHEQGKDRLEQIAGDIDVDLPDDLLPQFEQKLTRFQGMDPAAFDAAFIREMVDGHQLAIGVFQRQSDQSTTPALKQYAQSTLPTLRSHMENAKQLQTKVGGAQPGTPVTPPMAPPGQQGETPGPN